MANDGSAAFYRLRPNRLLEAPSFRQRAGQRTARGGSRPESDLPPSRRPSQHEAPANYDQAAA